MSQTSIDQARETWRQVRDRTVRTAREVWLFLSYLYDRFEQDRCTTAASSLTYTSLLAIVPLLTTLLLIMSAFPAFRAMQEDFRDLIVRYAAPDLAREMLEYLDRFLTSATQLGVFGLVGLLVTSLMLLFTIEATFNAIWRVEKSRSILQRALSFWAVLTVAPILFALSTTLSTMASELISGPGLVQLKSLFQTISGFVTTLVEAMAITIMYLILPNRRTSWKDALMGAFVAAVALELAKMVFRQFFLDSENYRGIYGQLATVPIFMLWLYMVWVILLTGAEIAAALPEWRGGYGHGDRPQTVVARKSLAAALSVMDEVLLGLQAGRPVRLSDLRRRLPYAAVIVEVTVETLIERRWLARSNDGQILLARDLDTVRLLDLVTALGLRPDSDLSAVQGRALWVERLGQLLRASDAADHALMCVPVRALLRAAELPVLATPLSLAPPAQLMASPAPARPVLDADPGDDPQDPELLDGEIVERVDDRAPPLPGPGLDGPGAPVAAAGPRGGVEGPRARSEARRQSRRTHAA